MRIAAPIAIATFALTLFAATPQSRYKFTYTIDRPTSGGVVAHTKIVDTKTNEVVGEPTITVKSDQSEGADITRGNTRFHVEVTPASDGTELEMLVFEESRIVQRTHVKETTTDKKTYTGQRMSMEIKDADIRTVLSTFADMANLEMTIDDNVTGKVTMKAVDLPWDEALDKLLAENGLASTVDGKKMHVFKK